METGKNFWDSKTVYLNAILTVMGACTLIADAISKDPNLTVPGVLMIVAGICGIVVRVWFTDQPINQGMPKAKQKVATEIDEKLLAEKIQKAFAELNKTESDKTE